VLRGTVSKSRLDYSLAVDVYSFAIVLFELVERTLPYDNNSEFPQFPLEAIQYVCEGGRPRFSEEGGGSELAELARECWAQDPAARPTFAAVLEALEEGRGGVEYSNDDDASVRLIVST
jgi:hypothetical protein